jgi:hypothetical protein
VVVVELDMEDKHGENNEEEEDERVPFGASPPRKSRQNKRKKTAKTKEK